MSIAEEDLKLRRLARAADAARERADKAGVAYDNAVRACLDAHGAWHDAWLAAQPAPPEGAGGGPGRRGRDGGAATGTPDRRGPTPGPPPMAADDDREGVAG